MSAVIDLYLKGIAEKIYKERIAIEEKIARGEEIELGITKEWRTKVAPYVDLANKVKNISELGEIPAKSVVIAYSLAALEALGRNNRREAEVYVGVIRQYLLKMGLSAAVADKVVGQIRQYIGLGTPATATRGGGGGGGGGGGLPG